MEVRIENLSIKFKGCLAVNSLNLNIKSGELVTLLGPSGCGKSTTIFTLAGVYKPDIGNVYFDDIIVNEVQPENRNIGMVFQNYSLYPHMTVYDNIGFPLKISKKSKKEIKEKIEQISKLVKIEDLLKRKPSQLSGGQQQRVAIARAIVKDPKVLLLDEPLSNLDARLRVSMREEIKKIQKKMKITTVFVTHDQEEAMSISDKIAILDNGMLQQFDTPMNLYKNPKNIFVAKFLGNPAINILKCRYDEKYNKLNILNKYYDISNFEILKNDLNDKELYKVGIRSEDFKISKIKKDNYIEAKIDTVENLGKDTVISVNVDNENISITIPSKEEYLENMNIYISFNLSKVMIFDYESGENITYVK